MSGRRSHPRVAVSPAAQGSLRLLRDVVVQRVEEREVVAISRDPGTKGEALVLEVSTGLEVERLQCHVIDSAPLIVDGCLRYRLLLQVVTPPTDRTVQLAPAGPEGQ